MPKMWLLGDEIATTHTQRKQCT